MYIGEGAEVCIFPEPPAVVRSRSLCTYSSIKVGWRRVDIASKAAGY